MPRRIAAVTSLLAFALCVGLGLAVDNPLSSILWKAIVAMIGTLVVGLVVGAMAQKMMDENVAMQRKQAMEKTQNPSAPPARDERK